MAAFYAYITHSGGLAVRKQKGLADFQQQSAMIKVYLGAFMAEDMDCAEVTAQELKDEHDREIVRIAIAEAVGAER